MSKLLASITSKHTDEDKQKLEQIAKKQGLSLSEYLRSIAKQAVDQHEYGVFEPMCQVSAKDTTDTKISLISFLGIEIVVDKRKAQQFAPVELLQSVFKKNTNMTNQIIPQPVVKTNTAVRL